MKKESALYAKNAVYGKIFKLKVCMSNGLWENFWGEILIQRSKILYDFSKKYLFQLAQYKQWTKKGQSNDAQASHYPNLGPALTHKLKILI